MPPWPTVWVRLAGQPQAVPWLCFMILKTRTVMTWPRQLEDWACCRLPLQTLQWILSQELLPQRLASHFPLTHLQSVQRRGHAFSCWVATQHTYYLWNVQRWESDLTHHPQLTVGIALSAGASALSAVHKAVPCCWQDLDLVRAHVTPCLRRALLRKGRRFHFELWRCDWESPPPTHTHIHLFQSLRLFRNSRFQGYP